MTTKPAPTTTVSVRLPRELWEEIVSCAASMSPRVHAAALVEHLLREALAQYTAGGR